MKNYLISTHLVLSALLLPAAILAPAPVLRADAPETTEATADDTYLGESPERYAQVRVIEGDVRIRKGDGEEALSKGIPVAEGDVVESSGRGVLQLGDGTRIAFGSGTRFTVAALFTEKDGQRQALLRVDHGRIRITLGSESDARIRVDTPSGTGIINDRGSVTFEVQQDRSVRVRVASGRISFSNEVDKVGIRGGECLTVYSGQDRLDRVREFNTFENDAFDEWAGSHMVARRRASWEHVPADIRYYSDDLDDNGEWAEVAEVGWCWRPRVSVEWRPYWQGRWGSYAGGMTWVSDEPWGYVTYHHGRWGWRANFGWYWIPGLYFAPAWVAWHSDDAYFGWAPLGYYNEPCHWGYGAWGGGYCWNIVDYRHMNGHHLHQHIHHDPALIGRFNQRTAVTSIGGSRPLTPPWRRGPLMIARNEFQRPDHALVQRALSRDVSRDRLQVYSRQAQASTGRVVLHRDTRTVITGPAGRTASPDARPVVRPPFEDRGRMRATTERPVVRDRNRTEITPTPGRTDTPARRPVETPRGDRRPDTPRAERPEVIRERPHSERPEVLRERPRDERPHEDRRPVVIRQERPEPSRERPREDVKPPVVREERRPEPVRERPSEDSRPPVVREERRPEPAREQPRPSESRPDSSPRGREPRR